MNIIQKKLINNYSKKKYFGVKKYKNLIKEINYPNNLVPIAIYVTATTKDGFFLETIFLFQH